MPLDKKGESVAAGDGVVIEGVVTSISESTVTVKVAADGAGAEFEITLDSRQVNKFGLVAWDDAPCGSEGA